MRDIVLPLSVARTTKQETIMNHQRKGSASNAHAGSEFEIQAKLILELKLGFDLVEQLPVQIGLAHTKKLHRFDLGSEANKTIIECKSHTWTKSGNIPSAKITAWREAMLYFISADNEYRKILFTQRSNRKLNKETLAEYFIRLNKHIIPKEVEIWEFDTTTNTIQILHK